MTGIAKTCLSDLQPEYYRTDQWAEVTSTAVNDFNED